jgi:nucleotide-binding universal stress UspA family protein
MAPVIIALSVGFVLFAALWYLFYARSHATKQGVLGKYVQERSDAVPDAAVDAAETVEREGDEFRVFVPISNPRTETDLISIAAAMARSRGGTVDAAHVVQVPDQTTLQAGADHVADISAESEQLLARAREDAETFDVDLETHTILSHRAFEEVFDAARRHDADLVVMGWSPDHPARAESKLDELTHDLPCDFLILRDRGWDPSRVLLPTAGGPDSDLSADVARVLQAEYDSEVTLLHAMNDDETEADAETFLADWAADHDLEDARTVVSAASPRDAIADAAAEHTLLLMGATERGLLSRLVRDSLHIDVLDDVECSVLLAERSRKRSLRDRLFGNR